MASWTIQTTPWDTGTGINDAKSVWSASLGRFVVTNGDSTVHTAGFPSMYSSDGVNWTGVSTNLFTGFYGFVPLRDSVPIFVQGASANPLANAGIYTSTDGIAWTFRTSPADGRAPFCSGYSSDLNQWVMGWTTTHPQIATATDPTSTWTTQTNAWGAASSGASSLSAAWGPSPASIWVVCGNSNIGNDDGVQTSPNGTAWTTRNGGVASPISAGTTMNGGFAYSVIWSTILGKFVLVGGNINNTKSISTSSDGITWTDVPTSPYNGGECLCVIEAAGKLWFGGYDGGAGPDFHTVQTTTDCVTFVDEACPLDGQIDTLAYSPSLGMIVAVGNLGSGATTSVLATTVVEVTSMFINAEFQAV